MTTFTAFCAKGHDRIDFTDRQLFEDHMFADHGRRKGWAGKADVSTDGRAAPGWSAAGILPPTPHVAPKRTPGGLTKVTDKIAAGDYQWPGVRAWGQAPQPAAELPVEQWERVSA